MDTYDLKLAFKGGRDYVSGSDILEALIEAAGVDGPLSAKFHAKATCALSARPVDAADLRSLRNDDTFIALVTCGTADIAVTENKSRPVIESIPFDEAAVTTGSTISGDEIEQPTAASGTTIERIVYLNKRLLNFVAGDSKWWFCGIDLDAVPPRSAGALKILNTSRVGDRFYRSAFEADGVYLGTVDFMR